MHQGSSSVETANRLLDVKRGLGHDLPARPALDPPASPSSTDAAAACVCCGYNQRGVRFDRCPECGLLFASQMGDPTEWGTGPVALATWLQTALRVWRWDRRTRVRTAIIPSSPDSRAFAWWSMLFSAPLLGLAFGFLRWRVGISPVYGLGYLTVESVLGGVGALLVMLLGQQGLRLALRGRWRRKPNVISACIDYATAWWPVLAAVALCCAIAYMSTGPAGTIPLALLMVSAVLVWASWLWSSILESQSVRFVVLRVSALSLCLAIGGHWLLVTATGMAGLIVKRLTAAAAPARAGITCAVVFDIPNSVPDPLILGRLKGLGVRPENLISVGTEQATLEGLKSALASTRAKLWPQDRFVFYLNCRGASDKPGVIQLRDGKLDDVALADLLSATPTDNNLIVIESESGETFVPSLKQSLSGIVVTCPDIPEFGHKSGLQDFWETLGEAESDKDKDGRITVDEAFDAAYRQMLIALAAERKKLTRDGRPTTNLNPELAVTGKADPKAFEAATPPPALSPVDGTAPSTKGSEPSSPAPAFVPSGTPAPNWDPPAITPVQPSLQ